MNTLQSNTLGKAPMNLWRRFQCWRAMRIYARVKRMPFLAEHLTAKADRLIGRNVRPPMPLFDGLDDREGR